MDARTEIGCLMFQGNVGGKCNAGRQPLKVKRKPGYRESREIWNKYVQSEIETRVQSTFSEERGGGG
ncbi:hypothetical protein BofuT4_P139800.1 [Botrytis cinerea T4]|uniref:Uncharacterized protein n=1 Tax=Botryotinia fuckeliana (strain T4) TaxID=999810 RepID=G2YN58_BOTF4|nr:hypothetical protein BofuT4_P139800.1 [Botrytis cinerea T4]